VRFALRLLLLPVGQLLFQFCRYQGRVLHAKTMLVDDLALVGSHNLNYRCCPLSSHLHPPFPAKISSSNFVLIRSVVHDLESEVILSHADSISTLDDAFVGDMRNSTELQLPALGHLRWWQRAAARLALLFKRML
jgi:phosphatidylserine/phosphatidylglycerophosphate/cardiolipin synthase-like enzyme